MPVKTVTILVQAMTDRANAQVKATSAIFDELRSKSPVEMRVKFDKAQAIAESRILAKEMSATVRDVVKLQTDSDGGLLARLFRGGKGPGKGLPGVLGQIPGAGPIPAIGEFSPVAAIAAVAAGLAALPFLAQAAAGAITLTLGGGLAALGVAGALGTGKTVGPGQIKAAQDALLSAQLRQTAAQDKLNQLMAAGATSGAKLASAQAAVASSSGSVATAQARLNKLLNDAQTPAQLATRKAFANLANDAQNSLATIGKSFQPVLLSIVTLADTILTEVTPLIATAVKAIAGPVQLIGNTLLRSFASPQVIDAVLTLGTAFGALLKAFAPSIPGIVTSIADGFTNIFRAIAKNPKAFADMATGLFHLVGVLLDVIAWLTGVAAYLETHFIPAWQRTLRFFQQWGSDIKHNFEDVRGFIYNDFILRMVRFFTSTLPIAFDIFKESLRVTFVQVVIEALKAAAGIASAFGHLPSFLGAPFRAAHKAIDAELARVQGSVANAVQNIAADWARLNGLTASFFIVISSQGPGGSGNFQGGLASGTSFATRGWHWVGERGPELAYMQGGETVLPAHVSSGYARGAGFAGGRDAELLDAIDETNGLLRTLIGVTAQAPATMGAAMGMGGRSAVYGALYP